MLPWSRLEVLARSGHFPHVDEPECFLEVLLDFLEETEPAVIARAGDALRAAG